MKNKILTVAIVCVSCLILSGCADSMSFQTATHAVKVGFWYGLWHGMTFPIAWIVSLFSDETAIYAIYNNGGWYDFGFFMGVGGFAGSSSGGIKK